MVFRTRRQQQTVDGVVGGYIFKCQTYVYHYGKAEVLGRTFVGKGQSISSAYLCAGEDHCIGALYAR